MPGAWVAQAADMFNEHPDIDVGIHLTLASEWDAVKWRPLTDAPSLTDDNGFFLPLVLPRDGDDRPSLLDADWAFDEVAKELRAQIALGMRMFRQPSHISAHMLRHLRDFDPKVGELVADLCAEFGLKDDAFGFGLPRIQGYPAHPRDAVGRTSAFVDQLAGLTPGTYIFIDHPAVASAELGAMGHTGYDDVMADRVACLETLTSDGLKHCVDDLGIALISYADL